MWLYAQAFINRHDHRGLSHKRLKWRQCGHGADTTGGGGDVQRGTIGPELLFQIRAGPCPTDGNHNKSMNNASLLEATTYLNAQHKCCGMSLRLISAESGMFTES